MKVLIIGGNIQAQVIAASALASPLVQCVVVAPGHWSIPAPAVSKPLDLGDLNAALTLALDEKPDCVWITEPSLLTKGLADILRRQDMRVYGASKDAMKLEDAAFAKAFMHKNRIPTANFAEFATAGEALECLRGENFPTVLKSEHFVDTFGARIVQSLPEAEALVRQVFEQPSTQSIIIEEYLKGDLVTVSLMVAGEHYCMLPCVAKYQYLLDGDQGPPTRGVGAYAGPQVLAHGLQDVLKNTLIEPTLWGLRHAHIDYRGALQLHIVLTNKGPRIVRYTAGLDAITCPTILPLFASDPLCAMLGCADGKLDAALVEFTSKAVVSVVQYASGHPHSPKLGEGVTLPSQLPAQVNVWHMGTERTVAGIVQTTASPTLCVTAMRETLVEAAMESYYACQLATFPSARYRKDIALGPILAQM